MTYSTLLMSPLMTLLYQTEAHLLTITSPTSDFSLCENLLRVALGAIQLFSVRGSKS